MIGPLSIDHPVLFTSKLVVLGIDFLIVFFNFTLAVRYYNHTDFMINIPAKNPDDVSVEDVIEFLDRGGTHYTLDMRGYYLAIPLALWLFGPLWMLSGTLLLITVLYRLDRGV